MQERDRARNKRHHSELPQEPPPAPRKNLLMQTPVLVLNASYEPINICAARRAIVLVLKGVAMHGRGERASAARRARGHACPSVIRSARIPPHPAPDARLVAQEHPVARPQHLPVLRIVFISGELTLDHVVPRSRGGSSPGKIWLPAAILAIGGRETIF